MQEETLENQRIRLSLKRLLMSPEKSFLTLALLFGMLFIVVLPPFQVPDEPAHFFRAYQVSEGKFISERKDNIPGDWLPTSLVITANIWGDRIPFRSAEKVKGEQFSESFATFLEKEKRTYVGIPTSAYSPIPYIPQAIGIGFGKLINLPPIWLLYLGRLSNLVFTTLLTFLAIKAIAEYKWLLFLLALTPMAVNQRASLSADASVNSVAFLVVAIIVDYACNLGKEKILNRDIALIAVLSMVLSLSKQVYFLLPFLCFMIPWQKFGSQKRYWKSCLLIAIVSTISWFGWSITTKKMVGANSPDGASIERQTQYLLSHPLEGISVAWNSFQDCGHLITEFIGTLGWLDTQLPTIITISYPYVLVLVALTSSRPNFVVTTGRKTALFLVVVSTVFLIYLSLYLYWTRVGNVVVVGVQGRYLIPIAPLFFLLLDNQRFTLKVSDKIFCSSVVYFSIFALTGSWLAIIGRFY